MNKYGLLYGLIKTNNVHYKPIYNIYVVHISALCTPILIVKNIVYT